MRAQQRRPAKHEFRLPITAARTRARVMMRAYRRVSHQVQRRARVLLGDVLPKELDISELPVPVRLPVRRVLALVLGVQGRAPVPPNIKRKDGDVPRGVLCMCVLVAANVLCKAVHEEDDGCWECRSIRACVEPRAIVAGQPLLDEVDRGDHCSSLGEDKVREVDVQPSVQRSMFRAEARGALRGKLFLIV